MKDIKNLELYKQLKVMHITLCDYFIHYGKLLKEQPHNARYLYIKMRISKLIRMISEFRKGMRINNIIVNSKG